MLCPYQVADAPRIRGVRYWAFYSVRPKTAPATSTSTSPPPGWFVGSSGEPHP